MANTEHMRQQLEKLEELLEKLENAEREDSLHVRLWKFSEIKRGVESLDPDILPNVQRRALRPRLEKLRSDIEQEVERLLEPILATGDEAEVRKGVRDYLLRVAPQDGPALDLLAEVLLYKAQKLEQDMGLKAIGMWRGILGASKDTEAAGWQKIVEEAEEAIKRLNEPDTLLRTVQQLEDEMNRLRSMVERMGREMPEVTPADPCDGTNSGTWKGVVLTTYTPPHGWQSGGTSTKPVDSETRSPDSWTWGGDDHAHRAGEATTLQKIDRHLDGRSHCGKDGYSELNRG